ncbi:unnamed protein product [Clonostachys rosea f. rosea IK726]|uniref:Uncharacterized protein n=1 Tax=Clonostachys rosea f. rosea IK726 TaxID=1349383 RepID=A0ACA9TJ67_BIOOC|nr:unnamed protein product [Clonostachys rosea f. rosea IK726]
MIHQTSSSRPSTSPEYRISQSLRYQTHGLQGFKASGPALSSSASTASGSSTTGLKATAVSTTSPTATLSTTSALSRSAASFKIAAVSATSPTATLPTTSALSRSAASFKIAAVSTTSPTATLSTTSALSRSAAGLNIAFFETIVEITLPELLLRVPWIDRQSKTSSLHDSKLAVGVVYVQSEPLAGETAPDESGKSEMLNDNHFDLMRGN